jgi:hypothetical protein
MAQLTMMSRFSQMMNAALLGAMPAAPLTERLTVKANEHYTISSPITSIRVLSGSAWISYLGKDIVLKRDETLEIETSRDIAVITSLSHKPVELELSL